MIDFLFFEYLAELICNEDEVNNKKLFCAKAEALMNIFATMQQFEKQCFDEELISTVLKKKCTMILKSESIAEIKEIAKPSLPIYYCGEFKETSKFHIEEEELLFWSLVTPNTMLVPHAQERVIALFNKFHPDYQIKE